MKKEGSLVWLDLEMTGLDITKDRIIEIAVLVTDPQLNVVAEGPDLVISQPSSLLAGMDSWNSKHHAESGLVQAVKDSSLTESEAEQQVLHFVATHCKKRKVPLAGNSIHVDRMFLSQYMPKLSGWLHYRNVDVSTIKELASRWYPKEYALRPKKKGNHRARDDIHESIAELRFYRESLFKNAGLTP